MKIKGLQLLDIITNSSSVTYTQAVSKKAVYGLLNEFLREMGSNKKAENVYDIYITVEYLDERLDGREIPEDVCQECLGMGFGEWTQLGWEKQEKIINGLSVDKHQTLSSWFIEENEDELGFDTEYTILLKDGSKSKLEKHLHGLFSSYTTYE